LFAENFLEGFRENIKPKFSLHALLSRAPHFLRMRRVCQARFSMDVAQLGLHRRAEPGIRADAAALNDSRRAPGAPRMIRFAERAIACPK